MNLARLIFFSFFSVGGEKAILLHDTCNRSPHCFGSPLNLDLKKLTNSPSFN